MSAREASKIPEPGALFAHRYRIDSVLGEGGMGVVLGARDQKTGVRCAIKILRGGEVATDRERMLREARALMLISSPHVVRIFDVNEVDGEPYLVLERLEGETLSELAPLGKRMPLDRVAHIAMQICDALSEAHRAGIIHRDIKLSNVFLAHEPEGRRVVKLLDFGISKLEDTPDWTAFTLTAANGPLGSPQFISPEQLMAPRAVDARTDLWSVGVVMFRLLTGRFPFEGADAEQTYRAILACKTPPQLDPELEGRLGVFQPVLDRCLTPDLAKRYASTTELLADLRPHTEATTLVRPEMPLPADTVTTTIVDVELVTARSDPEDAVPKTTPRPPRRSTTPLLFVGLGVLLTFGAVAALRSRSPDAPAPIEPAAADIPVTAAISAVPPAPASSPPPTPSLAAAAATPAPTPRPRPTPVVTSTKPAPPPASATKSSPTASGLRQNPYL